MSLNFKKANFQITPYTLQMNRYEIYLINFLIIYYLKRSESPSFEFRNSMFDKLYHDFNFCELNEVTINFCLRMFDLCGLFVRIKKNPMSCHRNEFIDITFGWTWSIFSWYCVFNAFWTRSKIAQFYIVLHTQLAKLTQNTNENEINMKICGSCRHFYWNALQFKNIINSDDNKTIA